MIREFSCDWAWIEVDVETGFATVRDPWEGESYDIFDSLDEAIEYCEG
jgi:hypothetical protein